MSDYNGRGDDFQNDSDGEPAGFDPSEVPSPHDSDSTLPESGPGSLAPIWARGVARVIDLFIVFTAALVILDMTGVVGVEDDEFVNTNPVLVLVVMAAVWCFYEVGGTIGNNRMVGKMMMGLRVRSVEVDQAPPVGRVFARWAPSLIAVLLPVPAVGIPLALLVTIYLSALLNPQQQGLHDRFARTLVVRAR